MASPTTLTRQNQVLPTFSPDQIQLIKDTVCKGATDNELQLFLYTARHTGLDPLTRQIHAVKRWDGKTQKETMAIQTGIDGYRLIAQRTGNLVNISDPAYEESGELPTKATVTVTKRVDDRDVEYVATARFSEFVQTKGSGDKQETTHMWKKMPFHMLGKCAEALALRKAFPNELSSLYTDEEMDYKGDAAPPSKGPAPVQRKSERQQSRPANQGQPEGSENVMCAECRAINGHATDCSQAGKSADPVDEKRAAKQAAWQAHEGHDPEKHINFNQGALLFVVQNKTGTSEGAIKSLIMEISKVESRTLIPKADFNEILDAMDPEFKFHERPEPF